MRFITWIGALTVPGQWPAGPMQAWALRRMGVKCPSNEVWIGPRVSLDQPDCLALGARVVIGPDARLTGYAPIEIGDDFLAAPGLYINTGTHHTATLEPAFSPITIGRNVWCGMRVTICSGVTIGDGATIGTGSVVLGNIPAQHLAVGVPCKPLKAVARSGNSWSNFAHKRSGGLSASPANSFQ